MNKIYSLILIVLFSQTLKSQDAIELEADLETSAYIFSEELPFWLFSNTSTLLNQESNFGIKGNALLAYKINGQHKIEVGLSGFYRDGTNDNFQRNNLFLRYANDIFKFTVGSEEVRDRYQNLGVVRNNFTWSGNARAIPGFKLELTSPLKLFKHFYVDVSIGNYFLNDDRIVNDAQIHNKSIDFIWYYSPNNSLKLAVEHFAQWSGNSSITGKQPNGFSDFIDVFFARRAGEEANINDQLNSLGNSLGYFNLEYNHSDESANYTFYHQHPFEDGSGTRLRNFPDGIWGFYYELNEENYSSILKGFLIEYVSTISQSGRTGRSGRDNYFNNRVYRSGWTYEGNVIGLPFIDVPSNSRVEAFHLGFLTKVNNLETQFKGTYLRSLGTYFNAFDPIAKQWFFALDNTYSLNTHSAVKLRLGYDINNNFKDNFGAGISYVFKL